MMKDVLVISVHPDDETLGCGATLLRLKAEGARLHWVIVTQMTDGKGFSVARIAGRQREIEQVADAYGFVRVDQLRFPTMALDTVATHELVEAISDVARAVRPDTVFIPNCSDAHSDHRVTFEAAAVLLKTFRFPSIQTVLMYETLSETDFAAPVAAKAFMPDFFVDVTAYLDKKISVMAFYKGELGEHPFPRSAKGIESLAVLRGAVANVKYAEAFVALKQIV